MSEREDPVKINGRVYPRGELLVVQEKRYGEVIRREKVTWFPEGSLDYDGKKVVLTPKGQEFLREQGIDLSESKPMSMSARGPEKQRGRDR